MINRSESACFLPSSVKIFEIIGEPAKNIRLFLFSHSDGTVQILQDAP